MHIEKIIIKNFRLPKDVELRLANKTTLIVGRNNSGKTSLTELFRRLLDEQSPRFRLEDFSLSVYEDFWKAYQEYKDTKDEEKVRQLLPSIRVELLVQYEADSENYGPLSDFIIDLNPDCTIANICILYELAEGKIPSFFDGIVEEEQAGFFRILRELIPKFFKATISAKDPGDPANIKNLEFRHFRNLFQVGFINAQRSLDDTSHGDKAVLGKILEALFKVEELKAEKAGANTGIAKQLEEAVKNIQDSISEDFNTQLLKFLPTVESFGYPGLSDPRLRTETNLEVNKLLSNFTTFGYEGIHGINLPESYNGLGPRNLIFMLLKLFEFFRSFLAIQPTSKIHLVFIEEPEAHLHPQMQSVFIRQISEIARSFGEKYNGGLPWPVQFLVTTHSSHIANEANFSLMRYFHA